MQLKGQVCTVGAETGPGATAHRGARVIFTTLHTSRWPRERPEQPLWVTGKAEGRGIRRHSGREYQNAHRKCRAVSKAASQRRRPAACAGAGSARQGAVRASGPGDTGEPRPLGLRGRGSPQSSPREEGNIGGTLPRHTPDTHPQPRPKPVARPQGGHSVVWGLLLSQGRAGNRCRLQRYNETTKGRETNTGGETM